jgi:pimeloyl-ACP methyl ester carboxylesterase
MIGELATRYASAASVRHMLRKSFARPERMPGDALLRGAAQEIRSGRRDLLRVERAVRWADTERDLPLVRCPALILWGDRDRYFPVRLLPRFTGRMPAVDARVLTGCGHSPHDDCPERVDPLLTRFLEEHDA